MDIKNKYRLAAARLESLKKELSITQDMFDQALKEFSEEFLKHVVDDSEEEEEPETQEEEQSGNQGNRTSQTEVDQSKSKQTSDFVDDVVKDTDEELKKIFKKIAKETHPDLLHSKSDFEREKKKDLFNVAKTAIEKEDYFELTRVAAELGIDTPPPTLKHVRMVEETSRKIEQEIRKFKNSVAWTWWKIEDVNDRIRCMNRYVEALKTN